MIQYTHIDQRQRLFQRYGQCLVGAAGFGQARRMIVRNKQWYLIGAVQHKTEKSR